MPNIIYVLTNEAMPGLVKIGFTESLEDRIRSLTSTPGVPLPFECYYAAEVEDGRDVERKLHQLFSEFRINHRREFFRIDPEKVVIALSLGKFKEVTPQTATADPEEQIALEEARRRRPKLNMAAIGILPGAELTFSRDEARKATVVEGNKVLLDGQVMALAPAALKILRDLGYASPSASGAVYWMYEGELLDQRRRRLEAEQFCEPEEV